MLKKQQLDGYLNIIETIKDGLSHIFHSSIYTEYALLDDMCAGVAAIENSMQSLFPESHQGDLLKRLRRLHANITAFLPDNVTKQYYVKMIKAIHSIEREIQRYKKKIREIVFLPYNASMWDAMHSVWQASCESPMCDVFVVPIPYFTMDGMMHCEIDRFPAEVQAIPYELYDIAESKPDIIYIHNIYDEGNLVTRVMPQYYTSELKKHTKMLVYIPYFVSDNFFRPQFCIFSTLENVDFVPLQSQTMVAGYAEYGFSKTALLGSPKLDYTLMASEVAIDLAWQKQSEGRKVVFYNTSIAFLLKDTKQAVNRIRETFEWFAEHSEICLLWRPHPLSKVTMRVMRPEYYKAYEELEAYFTYAVDGILDITADYRPAFQLSDAYLGSFSSLVWLYGITGKPILIEQAGLGYSASPLMRYLFVAMGDDAGYFIDNGTNVLYGIQLSTGKMLLNYELPYSKNKSYGIPIKCGDKLIITPRLSKSISVYDLLTARLAEYPIDLKLNITRFDSELLSNNTTLACYSVVYENRVFFPVLNYPAVIRFDAEKGEVCYFTDWVEPYMGSYDLSEKPKDTLFGGGEISACGNKLYCVFNFGNRVLCFDMESCEGELIEIGEENMQYLNVCADGQDLWLTCDSDIPTVVRYSLQDGKTIVFPLAGYTKQKYINMCGNETHIYLNPYETGKILQIDKKTNEVSSCEALNSGSYTTWIADKLFCFHAAGDYYKVSMANDGDIEKQAFSMQLAKPLSSLLQSTDEDDPHSFLIHETPQVPLRKILVQLEPLIQNQGRKAKQARVFRSLFARPNGKSGEAIHEYVINMLKE